MPVPPQDRARRWLQEFSDDASSAPADETGTGVEATVVRATAAELIIGLGEAMARAGESVDGIQTKLTRMAAAYGLRGFEVVALPTMLLVQTMTGVIARVRLRAVPTTELRVDQIADIYRLVDKVQRGGVGPATGLGELWAALDSPPRYGRLVRILGYATMSVGFSLILQPSVVGVCAAAVLGALVGVLTMAPIEGLRTVQPVVAAFLVSLLVFGFAEQLAGENPLRILIPPLIVFLPGVMLTTGFVELASAQMISGSSRILYGAVTLALLALGITAASTLVNVPASLLVDNPARTLGVWAPWVGILLIAWGQHLHFCAPIRMVPAVLAVLVVTYTAQQLGGLVFSAELSGFFGAMAMTLFALYLDASRKGPPMMVTFMPGFAMLVPGAASLIGLTEAVTQGGTGDGGDFLATLGAFLSIALGVLIGAALFNMLSAGLRAASGLPRVTRRRPGREV